jgi:tyrocidine synthetase-3
MPAGRLEIDSVPIGIPVENVRVYLLDKGMKIVPKGEEGEIYIGGEGIARGYTNAPELTQLSFIPNPFVDGERLYKTGDLGRCGSDGNVEFLGRVDNQIKLRGMRLEPGEIESFCLDLVEIESAALVVVKQKDGNQLLVLFYKIAGCVVFNEERLRSLLREKVPDYFVPNKFISIPEMPTTSSGKIDRSRLVAHYEEGIMPSIITGHATGSMHSILYDVWKKYLSVDQFEEAAEFFALGGDSFSTMNVIHEVFELYDVELAPADLFENSSFESFCSLVAKFVSFKSSSSM